MRRAILIGLLLFVGLPALAQTPTNTPLPTYTPGPTQIWFYCDDLGLPNGCVTPFKIEAGIGKQDCNHGLPCGPVPWTIPQLPQLQSPTPLATISADNSASVVTPTPTTQPPLAVDALAYWDFNQTSGVMINRTYTGGEVSIPVLNGTFDTDVSSWQINLGLLTWDAGKARASAVGGSSRITQNRTSVTTATYTYLMQFDLISYTTTFGYLCRTGGFYTTHAIQTGTNSATCLAGGAEFVMEPVIYTGGGAFEAVIDNVRLTQIGQFDLIPYSSILSGAEIEFDGLVSRAVGYVNSGAQTFYARVKPSSAGEQSQGRLWHKLNELSIGIASSSRNLTATINCATTNAVTTTSTALSASQWSTVIATFDGSLVRFYINGVEAEYSSQTACTGARASNTNPFYVGNDNIQARTWHGAIDEMALWTEVLSPADVDASLGSIGGGGVNGADLSSFGASSLLIADQVSTLTAQLNATPYQLEIGGTAIAPESMFDELGENAETIFAVMHGIAGVSFGPFTPLIVVFMLSVGITALLYFSRAILTIAAAIYGFIRRLIQLILDFIPG